MDTLHLRDRQPAEFGCCYGGEVETEDRIISVTWREPANPDRKGNVYVMTNGWLATQGSMKVPAVEAVRAGHCALTFDYTNKGTQTALEENTKDFVEVVEALPVGLKRRALGLSMGGRVQTRGLAQITQPVEVATTVASAGFIPRHMYGWRDVGTHFAATAPEITTIIRGNPIRAAHLGTITAFHCFRRGLAVAAELGELVQGDEHDTVRRIKAMPNAPYLRFMYGDSDHLFPQWAQEESIKNLPFDHVEMYRGGHINLVHDPTIARRIFELDANLPGSNFLSRAA